jgi:hypothetical protein
MGKYSKPVWQMVKEALEELRGLTGPTAVQYIRDHYPRDNVNKSTIQLQLIACSVNHTSARQFDDPNRFLWYLGNGHYRAYDPDTDEAKIELGWKIIRVPRPKTQEPASEETPFSRVEAGNRIALPSAVTQSLGLGPNDIVAFVEERGKYYIRKGRLKIEVD